MRRGGSCRKWELIFIKDYISSNIHPIGREIKTLITFMIKAVPKKDATFGTKIKFVGIVWMKVRPTRTAKGFEKIIVRSFMIENFKWGFIFGDWRWKAVNEISRSEKGFIPI